MDLDLRDRALHLGDRLPVRAHDLDLPREHSARQSFRAEVMRQVLGLFRTSL
jgi:hypothetical protein